MSSSPDIQSLLQQAASAGASGDLPLAERFCQQVLALDPRDADALRLMGMVGWRSGDVDRGERLLRESLAVLPGQPQVLADLGDLLVSKHDTQAALGCYAESVRLAPDFAEAWLKLGIARGEEGDIHAAIDALQRSLDLRPADLRALYAMAQARVESADVENAIVCYRRALALDPEAVEVHAALNELLWEHGMRDEYLGSYPLALEAAPGSLPLRLRYADALSHSGRDHEAEAVLREASRMFGPDGGIYRGLGASLASQGRTSEALESLAAAVDLTPGDVDCRQDLARILISTGDYPGALGHIDAAIELAPLDQRNLAFRSLCWRLSGDERAALINDYDRFVKHFDVPVPDGYADIRAFNQALGHALDSLHQTEIHPLNQTLRGGTQTSGNLFARRVKEVQEVRAGIERCIRQYIEEMDDDPGHPFLSRKSGRFRFSGSWSCRLGQQGFHTNHVHLEGWISSCYYVSLPDAVSDSGSHAGWLKFGETNLQLGNLECVEKIVQPKEGRLVLFPSYLFHGTVPFSSDEVRTTIAFDVMPV